MIVADGAVVEIRRHRLIEMGTDSSADEAIRQLDGYFSNNINIFDLPLAPAGTDFQRRVWVAAMDILYGSTTTYGELAAQLGTAPRAVGQALKANPIPVVIPCHRIVACSGSGGYGGIANSPVKRIMLTHESSPDNGRQTLHG
ncbi:MAG: methylated-DNA--[protein]-cysteine S-methyltransferase [Pseudomonadota bacterium]|nr:methylated-DNA--[protein]-cysteine S-methyltransferase [Pseudomonadota bacterium]